MVAESNEEGEGSILRRVQPASAPVAVVAIFFALITGGLAAVATTALGQSLWAFPIVAVISGGYLWKKRLATEAAETGLYIIAALLMLTPILSYVPTVLGIPADPKAPMRIWNILGFVTWGVLFLLVAIVIAALGYRVKGLAAISELNGGRFPL